MKTSVTTLDFSVHIVLFSNFVLEITAFHILVKAFVRFYHFFTHIIIYLCPKALNIKSFCLDELLSHTHRFFYSDNHIDNTFFHRKDNGGLFVLLYSYLYFVINVQAKEKMLEFMHVTQT